MTKLRLWFAAALALLGAAVAALLGARRRARAAERQADSAHDAAQAAEGAAIAERLAREQAEILAQRECEHAAIQKDLNDDLAKIESDPAAATDAAVDAALERQRRPGAG